MDWKNIKTIFIFTFLILNIYLGIETFEKLNPNYQKLASNEQTNRIEDLKFEVDIPKAPETLSFITGKSTLFEEKDKEAFLAMNSNQKIKISSDTIINSTLIKPYPIQSESRDKQIEQLTTFIEDYVPMGDVYMYWKHDETRNVYIFQQKHDKIPIQFTESINEGNMTGLIEVFTKDGMITGYRLSNLKLDEIDNDRKIISARDALRVQEIPPGATIKDINLVYFTIISDEEQFQLKVFVPSWHIVTENEELYINATDSSIIRIKTNEESEVE